MEITPDVLRLDCTSHMSCAYAVRAADGVTLIDTSFPGLAAKILAELAVHGIRPADVNRILLTHADADHIGNAARLAAACDCEVYIRAPDLAVALGNRRHRGAKGLVAAVLRVKCPPSTRPMPKGEIGGFTILPTPGHSPGHCCFRFGEVLFLGDLLFSSRDRLRRAPALYILDKARNEASIKRLDLAGVRWLCPGHGPVVEAPADGFGAARALVPQP